MLICIPGNTKAIFKAPKNDSRQFGHVWDITRGFWVRSCMAISRLRIIAEWLGFVGFICSMLAGMILACVFYPLILCAQWATRILGFSKAAAIIEWVKRLLLTRITISIGH